jgi:diacylglycerol O-acyltransferase
MQEIVPIAFLPEDHALAIAIMSYNGKVDFGLLADYDAMPDLAELAEMLEETLAELLEAARAHAKAAARSNGSASSGSPPAPGDPREPSTRSPPASP